MGLFFDANRLSVSTSLATQLNTCFGFTEGVAALPVIRDRGARAVIDASAGRGRGLPRAPPAPGAPALPRASASPEISAAIAALPSAAPLTKRSARASYRHCNRNRATAAICDGHHRPEHDAACSEARIAIDGSLKPRAIVKEMR